MNSKNSLKTEAVSLRKRGLSYGEILAQVPVAKSTLSLWLRSVGLSKKQSQRLSEKKLEASKKGARVRKDQRIKSSSLIRRDSIDEVPRLIKNNLWLMGVMLYWAEGSKQKTYNVSQRVTFANSDENMVRLFVKWLKEAVLVPESDILFELYIHESTDQKKALKFWLDRLGVERDRFSGVYLKKNKIGTKRKNVGESYNGLVRVVVRKSTDLNRRISGWVEGVIKCCPIV